MARPFFLPLSASRLSRPYTNQGRFDAPFSHNELVDALSKCHESAPSANCLPYSLFEVSFPWLGPKIKNTFVESQARKGGPRTLR